MSFPRTIPSLTRTPDDQTFLEGVLRSRRAIPVRARRSRGPSPSS